MFPVKVITLGCRLNQAESEAIIYGFKTAGYKIISPEAKIHGSGIIIINTCTVTSKADQKTRRLIRSTLSDNPEAFVILTGCYAQMNEINAPRLFIFKKDSLSAGEAKSSLLKLPEILKASGFIQEENPNLKLLKKTLDEWIKSPCETSLFSFNPKEFSAHSRAFLKIQDGCNNCCSYCLIRIARGPGFSLDADECLERLKMLENAGYAEVMLTGVNISQYNENGHDLGGLIEKLIKGSSSIALRLGSLEPEGITEKLSSVLAHPRIRPHFHLSVQSGSEIVLKKMNRAYSLETVEKGIALLRQAKENPFLACDIICGFPGETQEEFSRTINFLEKNNFAWVHAFPYSPRPGTPAFALKSGITEREKTNRVKLLAKLALEGRRSYGQYWLGRQLSAIVEKGDGSAKGHLRAVSENYLKLVITGIGSNPPPKGSMIQCSPETLCEGANGDKPDAFARLLL